MEKLNAAVIGLGRMGAGPSSRLEGLIAAGWLPLGHLECVKEIPGLELKAICDVNQTRLEELGEEHSVKGLYSDGHQLLSEVKPDFLCIATRTEGRTDLIAEAVENGASIIYFEKPISRSIADCKRSLQVAGEAGVKLGYGVNRRYHKVYREVKKLIDSGKYGSLKEVVIEHGHANLYWAHPHSVDLILFFAGSTDVNFIQGSCSFINDYEPEDHNFIDNDPLVDNAYFEFSNGVKGSVNQGIGLNTRLICEEGIVTIYSDGAFVEAQAMTSTGYLGKTELLDLESPKESATITAFRELVAANKGSGEAPITPEEIITGMIMLNGLVCSSLAQGRRISPSEVPETMVITGRSGDYYA
ncbi:MAG: Gfo/Idh/MocA family oxidoreductase [Roseivirga sp.]|nr:Gfo/Idh/MocA family oxidoreductase [Roseivirga sp.]